MTKKEILDTILNKEIPDKKAREVIEEIPDGSFHPAEVKEIIDLLKKERPVLFRDWHLEVASEYM